MTDPFRLFYQHHLPNLSVITDLPHRHFRFLLPHGTFLKLQDRIRSEEELRRWLARYRPSDVYYSTSCWLVPENLGRRERTPLSDNIFLSSDIVFDIDRSPLSAGNLELARQDTLRRHPPDREVHRLLREQGVPYSLCGCPPLRSPVPARARGYGKNCKERD